MSGSARSSPATAWRPGIAATVISAVLVGVDQLSKAVVQSTMALHESIPLVPSLNLTYTRNPGAAFSLLAEADPTFRRWFFLLVSAVALVLVTVFLRRVERGDWWNLTALSLILGGAVGNLIDRVRYGEVVDFIDVYIGWYHWPVFNVADSGITVGMVILLGHAVLHRRPAVRPAVDS